MDEGVTLWKVQLGIGETGLEEVEVKAPRRGQHLARVFALDEGQRRYPGQPVEILGMKIAEGW